MKHIVKRPEPKELADWKVAHPEATYKDLGRFKCVKTALRSSLLAEQGGLCCYCEARIDDGDFHIEHFMPKAEGMYPHLQLTYSNLHACCHRIPAGGDDECCGHKKSNAFSANLISPLSPDCESYFQYDLSGAVSSMDPKGIETISLLNLNSRLLMRSRKALIEYFEDLPDDEYAGEVEMHLDPSSSPFGEFFTTIKQLHGRGLIH